MEQSCPKCGGEMDEGTSATSEVQYFSNRQKGIFELAIPTHRARACLNCGYVELYLDAEALRKKIQK